MRKHKKTVKVLSIIFVVLAVMVVLIIGYCIHTTSHNNTVLNKPEEPVETVEEVDNSVYQTPEYPDEQSNDEFEYLVADDFKLTHYCHCASCCGKTGQPTASGRMPELGVTVSVDPNLIKLGSYLRIEIPDGNGGYIVYRAKARADDTGKAVKGKKIDVFVGGHQEAFNLGVIRNARVYLIGEQK